MVKNQFIEATVEKTDKGLVAVASTGSEDRHGEIVSAEGWELKNYKKNPVLLWAHDHTQPPIGQAKKVWIEGKGKRAKLMFEPVFHELTEFARTIKKLFEDGVLKTFSVGFKPIDAEGNQFTHNELLEISAVNVPANADAMMLAYKTLKGEVSDKTLDKLGIPKAFVEKLGSMEEKMKVMEGKLNIAVKGLQNLNPHRSKEEALRSQQTVLKAVTKASNVLVNKPSLPVENRVVLAKAIKLASEKLQGNVREQLNGTNQGT